jgi:imidazolonepropionase-like amidohydrolase
MGRTLFSGGSLLESPSGSLATSDFIVENGRILDLGTSLDADDEVALSGRTVLPGLIDCHTHMLYSQLDTLDDLTAVNTPFSYPFYQALHHLRDTLAQGVTTVRDGAGADLGVKRAVEDGLIRGPRMLIAITMLSQTGGHGDHWMPCGGLLPRHPPHPGRPSSVVDGVDAVRRRVREIARAGADVIKIATSGGVISPSDNMNQRQFSDDELNAIAAEAQAANLPVMAHAQGLGGVHAALRAGVRSIEHGVFLDDEAVEEMLRQGTWLVPTLSAPLGVLEAAEAGIPVATRVIERTREVVETHRESFRRALTAGVRIAMGTDSGVGPHGRNLRELELMRQAGMPPRQALAAATTSAARLLGLEHEIGALEPGKRADFVLLDGDPFDFPTLPDRIVAVYQNGRVTHGDIAMGFAAPHPAGLAPL